MLMKIVNGIPSAMMHLGVRYQFDKDEVKDCPVSMLASFRGFVEAVATDVDYEEIDETKSSIIEVTLPPTSEDDKAEDDKVDVAEKSEDVNLTNEEVVEDDTSIIEEIVDESIKEDVKIDNKSNKTKRAKK